LRERGLRTGVYKPIQSGNQVDDPAGDAARLAELSGVDDALRVICPVALAEPIAPVLALERAELSLRLDDVKAGFHRLRERYDHVLVEGAGGLAVPYVMDGLVADAVKLLGLPLIIVARAGLGTVNHTLLTVEYARQRGITICGIILCRSTPYIDTAQSYVDLIEASNPRLIARHTDAPILGCVPWLGMSPTRANIVRAIEQYVDVDVIVKRLHNRTS